MTETTEVDRITDMQHQIGEMAADLVQNQATFSVSFSGGQASGQGWRPVSPNTLLATALARCNPDAAEELDR